MLTRKINIFFLCDKTHRNLSPPIGNTALGWTDLVYEHGSLVNVDKYHNLTHLTAATHDD